VKSSLNRLTKTRRGAGYGAFKEREKVVKLERSDIQGLIFSAYSHLPCAAYLLLRIEDAAAAGQWLSAIAGEITTADNKQENFSINLALTYCGLARLGLNRATLNSFPIAFREGVASENRSRILGDTHENAPSGWDWGSDADSIHFLLLVYGVDEKTLEVQLQQRKAELTRAGGLVLVKELSAGRQPDSKEHFGFADGIGQPVIEGNDRHERKQRARTNHATVVKAGEFILGYVNEYGTPTLGPIVEAAQDPRGFLPPYKVPADLRFSDQSASKDLHDLGMNGSYLVFRQLAQDVAGFWKFLDAATLDQNNQSDAAARERLGAKFVGRWPSGAPLVLSPDRDDSRYKNENDFGFAATDRHGFACPVGSHIRRCNPRDSRGDDPSGSLQSVRRHRLMRRGRSYGHRISDKLVEDGAERGLHFICINADIERQFEFVQQTWINNTVFGGLSGETDPLAGNQDPALCAGMMTVPDDPLRRRISNLRSFVTVKGGGYFFLPGIKALRYLGVF
jgi:Dyp-type peroxidase family